MHLGAGAQRKDRQTPWDELLDERKHVVVRPLAQLDNGRTARTRVALFGANQPKRARHALLHAFCTPDPTLAQAAWADASTDCGLS